MKNGEVNLRDLEDNIKWTNICILGLPEREEREKGAEILFEEIMAENFSNLEKKQTFRSRKLREFQIGGT